MTALLGIDLGTGSAKAIVVNEGGRLLGSGAAEYPLSHPRPGWSEQNPEEWWRGVVQAVRQAVAAAGAPHIEAIGLSGQMHGSVLLDREGHAVRPAIIWADARSGDEVAELTGRIGAERLIEIAGSPLATGFQAASLAWVRRHEPEVWSRVHTILLPKDELRRRLSGDLLTDPSDAASTLLLDVRRRDWSEELLEALGIDRAQLPQVIESTTIGGVLSASAAAELSLREGIPIAGGGADAPLAALSAGVVRADQMALTISTGAQVIVPTAAVAADPMGRLHAWCNVLPPESGAGWYQMGATLVAGLALRWLRDEIFGLDGDDAYGRMTAWANAVPAGSGGLVFLPYLTGERTPHMNPHARGAFIGLTASQGRGNLVRAVMEGSTLALLDAAEALRSAGADPGEIVLSGGGAQSRLWRQIVADVFGLPVKPLRAAEQSAVGAAMLAGAAIGVCELAVAAEEWPTYDTLVEPDPAAVAVYREVAPIFRNAYRAHVDDFERLGRLPGEIAGAK